MLSPKDQIKERLSILDVVSQYTKLQKAGKNYKGLSPFSNEKTPSFFVSPDRDMYYCFSTNQGGDIFTFVEKMEGVDFRGALRILADKAGVELVHERKEVRDKRERLYEALETTALFYASRVDKHEEVTKYLRERGISEKTIEQFKIGFIENDWRVLYEYLTEKGFSEEELLEAGLIKKTKKEGTDTYYDTFRGRIMFPIFDSAGRVVAFTGRILPSLDDGKTGKYINSPETVLYNKSRILYGYNIAKGAIKKFNFSILVEGQMDTVMSHQVGYPNTIGVSGTALTQAQLTLLKRLSENIVMAFDADRAGIASAGRSAELALSMGMDVKVVSLEEGIDPADLIKKDKEGWKKAIREAVHVVEFYIQHLKSQGHDARKFKLEVRKTVLPFVARIVSPIDQAHFVSLVSNETDIPEEAIRAEIVQILSESAQETSAIKKVAQSPNQLGQEDTKADAQKESPPDTVEAKLVSIIFLKQSQKKGDIKYREGSNNTPVDPQTIITALEEILGKEKTTKLLDVSEDKRNAETFRAELLYEDEQEIQEDVADMLKALEQKKAKRELEEVTHSLRDAEREGDSEMSSKLLKKSKEIMDKISSLVGKS